MKWNSCILKTMIYWWKKLKKTRMKGNMSCAHGLEELIFLICPYYPKQSTDSMLFLSKSDNIFHRNRKKKSNRETE